jgi:ankyrin repeat protein
MNIISIYIVDTMEALKEAITSNNVREVCRLIYLKSTDINLNIATELAVKHGNAAILRILMNRQGGRYLPPMPIAMIIAAKRGHVDVIKVLVNRMIARDLKVCPSMIKLFIDGESVPLNERDSTYKPKCEMTPIEQERAQWTLYYLHQSMTPEEIAEEEEAVKKAKINMRLETGENELTRAVKYHDLKKIDSLITTDANIHLRDYSGLTPLGLADNIEVAMKLLAAGANINLI